MQASLRKLMPTLRAALEALHAGDPTAEKKARERAAMLQCQLTNTPLARIPRACVLRCRA